MMIQITDEQIKTAARKWIERLDSDAHWARSPGAREKASSERKILEGLLEAAAGAAPRAESGCDCGLNGTADCYDPAAQTQPSSAATVAAGYPRKEPP